MASGGLEPEPKIPNSERHKTGAGVEHFPYVRSIDGVSLFDFREFDGANYSERYPLSSWEYFVPRVRNWPVAVWVEVDRSSKLLNLLSPGQLLKNWKRDKQYGHAIMPMLEAACIGKVPLEAFASAFITWGEGNEIEDIDFRNLKPDAFAALVNQREKF